MRERDRLKMFHMKAHEIRHERHDRNVAVLHKAAESDPFLKVEVVRDWQYKVSRKGLVAVYWPSTNIAVIPGRKYGIGMQAHELLDLLHSTPFFR